jgi:hypothetical protein
MADTDIGVSFQARRRGSCRRRTRVTCELHVHVVEHRLWCNVFPMFRGRSLNRCEGLLHAWRQFRTMATADFA